MDLGVSLSLTHSVTLDMDMPEKGGTLFYAAMRKDEAVRDIPVIVVSGVGPRPPASKKASRSSPSPSTAPGLCSWLKKFWADAQPAVPGFLSIGPKPGAANFAHDVKHPLHALASPGGTTQDTDRR